MARAPWKEVPRFGPYRRMPAFFDDVGWARFRNHAPEYIKDETLSPHDEAPCTILSMNAKMGSFPDEIAKRCLLIYSAASLPSDDESSRIVMSNQLSSIEPTTHLYRRTEGEPRNAECTERSPLTD